MTVSAQPRAHRTERRIIERPRLIKLLDETDARTILLLAPAGYGKTTLARQWAKTLNGAVWLTLTPAHRDIAVFALEVASSLTPDATARVTSFVRAQANPQRAYRETAGAVAEAFAGNRIQWVVLDDCHELNEGSEADLFVEALVDSSSTRFLIASRTRPRWATARRTVYGDVAEISRDDLAMTEDEARTILRGRGDFAQIAAQADGWPAVIGLAASTERTKLPERPIPSMLLHDYFTEELFRAADPSLQRRLFRLALAPELDEALLSDIFGASWRSVIDDSYELGFISIAAGEPELHPLFRDFLLDKLTREPNTAELVEESIDACVRRQRWDRAFDLIARFKRDDLIEATLDRAYSPLIRSGQLGTLAAVSAGVRRATAFPPPVVDLAEAEIALRDGAYGLADGIARRALARLSPEHHLHSRGHAIIGQAAFVRARLSEAEAAYRAAFDSACTDQDRAEALRGWALASVQGETSDAAWVVAELTKRRNDSPLDLVRCATVELALMHFASGLQHADTVIQEAEHALPLAEDPRARSSCRFAAAYIEATRGHYSNAARLQREADAEILAFGLDFAQPHMHWNNGFIDLGLRRFAAVERHLQRLEDCIPDHPLGYHVLNARILRSRLALQTGKPQAAVELLPPATHETAIPSIHGEYLATRALALACSGAASKAVEAADAAIQSTSAVEVRVIAETAHVIAAGNEFDRIVSLWELAHELDVWDPVVGAARSSFEFADALASVESLRAELAARYTASNDLALARRARLRVRPAGTPHDLLSPREFEVLSLLARGYRNRDIADALVVSNSTIKVHIRHILEKLGVRTRAEAVARLDLD